MGEEITYKSLRNRQKQEERAGLTRLDPDFYRRARARIEELREEYRRAHDDDPGGQRTMVLLDEVNKMQETLQELYHLRERKVVLAAIARARGGRPDVDHLTPVEEELFETVVGLLQQQKARALEGGEGGGPGAEGAGGGTAGSGDAGDAEDASGVSEEDARADEAPSDEAPKAVERALVRVLEDLEPFVASDMHTYALAADDIVHLPKEQAEVLCKRGKAVELPGTVD